jgi:hypothetical protein
MPFFRVAQQSIRTPETGEPKRNAKRKVDQIMPFSRNALYKHEGEAKDEHKPHPS